MPDREELLRVALALYREYPDYPVSAVERAEKMIGAVDEACLEVVSWSRVSHGQMAGAGIDPCGTFSVTVGEGETLASLLAEKIPEVRALVSQAEEVMANQKSSDSGSFQVVPAHSIMSLHDALVPFREKSDA